jgi:hypothetical protein
MSKARIAKILARTRPTSAVYHSQKDDEPRKLTLAEKIHLIHGAPKWKSGSDDVMSHWRKLAGAMTQGVTNIMRGRAAGSAGVSMSKIPGKALSSQTTNPNRSIKSALNVVAPRAAAPKAPSAVG